MENIINTLFGEGLFSNLYFVDSNPATVKTIEIKKVDSEIQKVENISTFKLESYQMDNTGLISLNIRSHIKKSFFELIDQNSDQKEIKYFDRGFIKNLFYPKNPNEILDLIKGQNWIITSDSIIAELTEVAKIEYIPCYADIRLVGKIENTLIYKSNHLKNEIYIGTFDCITPIFNRNIITDSIGKQNIEYLLNINSNLTKIAVY